MPSLKSKTLHKIGNGLFKYIYKNPERNMLRLVKVGKAFAGKMYPESTFTKPIEIITDESNVWHQFLFRGIKEVNPDFLRRAVLTFGIDLGLIGTSTLRKRERNCTVISRGLYCLTRLPPATSNAQAAGQRNTDTNPI